VLIIITAPLIVLEQRNVVVLTTTAGVRLVAIWKQKLNRWYIVVESEDKEKERRAMKKVVDKLTPHQFQNAVEKGRYSFAW
jgi:hypothetical protein